jgi:hypothetical protein
MADMLIFYKKISVPHSLMMTYKGGGGGSLK